MSLSLWRNLVRRGSRLLTPEHRPSRRRHPFSPRLEALENRLAPAVVTNNLDLDSLGNTVPGSLRWAIEIANAPGSGDRVITFNLPPDQLVIAPTQPLPKIVNPDTVVNGLSQPSAALFAPVVRLAGVNDGLTIVAPKCAVFGMIVSSQGDGIVVEADHTDIGYDRLVANGHNGVRIDHGASFNRVYDSVFSSNGGAGVLISGTGTTANEVFYDIFGLEDFNSTVLRGNLAGVEIAAGASDNVIHDNGIDANTYGIELLDQGTAGNVVKANTIGCLVGPAGVTVPVGNTAYGVYITNGAGGNIIGGTTAADMNLISANIEAGVFIDSGAGNVVEGNKIGTNFAGDAAFEGPGGPALPLGNRIGVDLAGSATATEVVNNVISGNILDGVQLRDFTTGNMVEGNKIGTNLAGTSTKDAANGSLGNGQFGVHLLLGAFGNTVDDNVISGNGNHAADSGAGVYINDDGTTANLIKGNYIGTNAYGTDFTLALNLGNAGNGVAVVGAPGNNVVSNVIAFNGSHGVDVDTGRNNVLDQNQILDNAFDGVLVLGAPGTVIQNSVISGNHFYGVEITRGASKTLVKGNLIGTSPVEARGNGLDGVHIQLSSNNTVTGNTIAGNLGNGVIITDHGSIMQNTTTGNVILGNFIGTNAGGTALGNAGDGVGLFGQGVSGNTVTGNVINDNAANGVDVSAAQGNTVSMNHILANALDGVSFESGASGNLVGGTAAGNTISGNGQNGVELRDGASANRVQSNFIGTDVTGKLALGNRGQGVLIWSGPAQNSVAAVNNVIYANVVSANQNGVIVYTSGNLIQGNVIGTDSSGTKPLPNAGDGVGVFGQGASSNTIMKNIIDFNKANGVQVSSARGNTVSGNAIVSNALDGVLLEKGASGNLVGGTAAGAGNTIASNGLDGVQVDASSFDSIRRNAIYANRRLGIDLTHGGNGGLRTPVLLSAIASATKTTIRAASGGPVGSFTIEVFLCDSSSPGQGKSFLISQKVTTDGHGAFTITLPSRLAPGTKIVVTATDPNGDTSAFSAAIGVR